MNDSFLLIANDAALKKAAEEWKKESYLGIDVECENNLHHYGVRLALIQVSSANMNWIIDPLAIKDFSPLKEVLESENIEKIFHDTGFDLRMFGYELKIFPKNIFDTQLAAMFLNKKSLGLGGLLEEYFGVKKESKHQRDDWLKRPLTAQMLSYAVKDSSYLHKLTSKLKEELKEKGRLEWVLQEMKAVEEKRMVYETPGFFDLKGIRELSDKERAILKRIYSLREELAKKTDRPVHFIISTKRLIELAISPPDDWSRLKGVHPIVKRYSKRFSEEVDKGRKENVRIKAVKKKRRSAKEQEKLKELFDKREKIAKKAGITPALLMSKEQMDLIVRNKAEMRPWQKELFKGVVHIR